MNSAVELNFKEKVAEKSICESHKQYTIPIQKHKLIGAAYANAIQTHSKWNYFNFGGLTSQRENPFLTGRRIKALRYLKNSRFLKDQVPPKKLNPQKRINLNHIQTSSSWACWECQSGQTKQPFLKVELNRTALFLFLFLFFSIIKRLYYFNIGASKYKNA